MGSVKSTLELIDKVTKPLDSINSRLGITVSRFDNAGKAADSMSNESGKAFSSIKSGANAAVGAIGTVNNAFQSVQRSTGGLMKTMLGVAAIQKAVGVVGNQMSNALDRMDTLTNFPKVMSNLGIGTKAAQGSIEELSDELKGLPTTLQDAASSVQRFTSANGDVKKSTQMFLALNNAILAGGADAQIQQSALEQLSQSYAKGKPDMMEWRAAMTAMPAQLRQVSNAMGFVSADELGESLRKGETSMDDFMDTIVKMNKTSVAGFRTLEEQAKNATGGFATSIANMKSAVTRGLTGMVENINEALHGSGLPSLQEMIAGIGQTIEKVLKVIGTVFGKVIGWISENKEEIASMAKTILSVAVAWTVVSGVISAVVAVVTTLSTVISVLGGVMSAVLGVAAVLAIGAIADGVSGLIGWFTDLNERTGDIGHTMEIVFANIGVIIAKVKKVFVTAINFIKIAWNTMCLGFEVVFKGAAAVILTIWDSVTAAVNAAVKGIIKIVGRMAEAVPGMSGLGVSDVYDKMADQIDIATHTADSLWDDIADSTLETDKENRLLQDEIDSQDDLITRAEADAKAIEDRYTRNLGNDRGTPTKDDSKEDDSKGTKTNPVTNSIASNTGRTAANTKTIAKQLAVNGETLKYLKDYAETKVINRYTSPHIKIDMKNNNSINNEMDLDGVVSGLKLRLERELASTAAGVHA